MCSSDKRSPIFFLCLSKVWSIFCHWLVGRVHKKMLLNAFMYFFSIFLLFFIIKFVFLSFSDEISNLCNRILSNQKRELVVSNQRNCVYSLLKNLLTFQRKSTFRIKILPSLQRKLLGFHVLILLWRLQRSRGFWFLEGSFTKI